MAYDVKAAEALIRQRAASKGMDTATAVRVARSEGLANGIYQSNLGKGGRREPSYGPFQLLVGGPGTGYGRGLGNAFMDQTGLDPRDPTTVPQQIDFALDQAKSGGWSPWYGAAKVGVGKWDGIRAGEPTGEPANIDVAVTGTGDAMAYGGAGDDMLGTGTGGLGGLGGKPAATGFRGFIEGQGLGDMLQAIGTSLMSSTRDSPLANFGTAYEGIQDRRMRQAYYDDQRADRQEARDEKRASQDATVSLLMSRGMSMDQVRSLAASPSAASAALEYRDQDATRARGNMTADRLATSHPDIADAIRDGSISGEEGWKLAYQRDREGVKAPNLETIYTEDGREQKGYFDRTGAWTNVGNAKAASGGGNGVTISPDGTIQVGGAAQAERPARRPTSPPASWSTRTIRGA